MLKHKRHGWIKAGTLVRCSPKKAYVHVMRRELIRCTGKLDGVGQLLRLDSSKAFENAMGETDVTQKNRAKKAKAKAAKPKKAKVTEEKKAAAKETE
jgi:hypothetical protein